MKNTDLIEKNKHISDTEIEKDISDTQKEIDDYIAEQETLMRNPQENKVRLYFLNGKISQRQEFIKKLNRLVVARKDSPNEKE